MHKTALIIPCYKRPVELKQCLQSIRESDLSRVSEIFIFDDASSSPDVSSLIDEFQKGVNVRVWAIYSKKNKGIKGAMSELYECAFVNNDIAINVDSDAICKPNFIDVLLSLKSQHPRYIVSGFNCNNPKNPVLSEGVGFVKRKHCNGINMVVDKQQYETIIKPALSSSSNWDFAATHDREFIISSPSVIQHIAPNNSTMGHTGGDVACDFKLLSLPQVALFGIDAHDPEGLLRAAGICKRDVEFGAEVIITQHDYFRGREGYSKFMIRDLWQHVKNNNCTHVLTIHGDGFIQNPKAWNDEWLNVDYLGATWVYKDGMNNGNGGFSLRSKKLIEICSRLDIQDFHPEDCKLSRKYRPFLEKEFGLVWGTEEQANRFSIEAYGCGFMQDSDGQRAVQYTGSFGHHGYGILGLPHAPAPKKGINNVAKVRRR